MTDWEESEGGGSTWKPEKKGDSFVGLLVKVEDNVGINKSMLYTFEEKDTNEAKVVWGSTVLDQKMFGIKVGEEVKIVYQGKGEAKAGKNAPKLFNVFHREPTGGYSEDAF